MKDPEKLKFGPKPLMEWGDGMREQMLKRTPISSDDIIVEENEGGLSLSLAGGPRAKGSGYFEEKTVPHLGGVSVQGFWVDAPPRDP